MALVAVGVGGALFAGVEVRARQEARTLSERARSLLHANTTAAPELQHLQADRARMFVDEALGLHESDELRGLRHLTSALSYLQKGDRERALQRLDMAEGLLGESADSLALRGALEAVAGRRRSAKRLARRALGRDPKHLRARVLLVDASLDEADAERALTLLNSLVREGEDSAALHNRRGIALETLGRLAAAEAAFDTAVRRDGRLSDGHLNRGRVLRARGQAERALAAFLNAARLDPTSSAAVVGAALCRLELGDRVGAVADLERAHAMGDGDSQALLVLGDLDVVEGDLARAIVRFRAAIALAPERAHAYLKLGNALMRAGDFGEAAGAFERAIDRDGSASAAHNGLGAALSALGRREEAALSLARAADLDRSDPNPWLNLARLHQQGGDLDQARQALAAARQRDPEVMLAGL